MKTMLYSWREHCLVIVSIFLITAALIAGMVGCDDTTQNLEIRDWHDLDAVRDNLTGNYTLMNDLDSTTAGYTELASPTANEGKGWEPIGTRSAPFIGTFDGQGYEICDLFINLPEEGLIPFGSNECVGLFGVVDEGGHIEDIGVVNTDVTGFVSVGGLVGEIEHGTVSNSYFTGSVTGYRSVGGLLGHIYHGTISNSHSTGSVTGSMYVGGLMGGIYDGTVSNSYYNYDEVLINGDKVITIGALSGEDFEEWLANDKFLDVHERLSQENGYYVVNNVTDFKELLAFGQDSSLKFRLKNDLDLAAEPDLYIPYLAGEFDGNGHKISNLSFNSDLVYQVGLFGQLASGGKVANLGAGNVNITGDYNVGGLVARNWGDVSNSYATGSVFGYHYCLGGLVGLNRGNVRDSNFTGSVTRAGYVSCYVGGLVGINEGIVSNSYATGSVTGSMYVGGLVGKNEGGIVSNSHATGNVTCDEIVGGLVGENHGTVSNSYSRGDVTGNGDVGGLVGYSRGTVSNSYATGSVIGYLYVGGLVGENLDTVSNSYSTGSVAGSVYVGGLVGVNLDTVNNSYSTGSVTGNDYVGGLVGSNYLLGNNGTVSSSFWDIETSGQSTSDGGTGKTTAQMQDITTFSGAGCNIIAVANPGTRNASYVWNIVDGETYPFMSWQA